MGEGRVVIRLEKLLLSRLIILAASALAFVSVGHAATVVISTPGDAEAAGFSQPYENRNHPEPTGAADPVFPDSQGGSNSLLVTLTKDFNGVGDPGKGGYGGVAIDRPGITDDLSTIISVGDFSFDYYDTVATSEDLVVKVWCITNGGVTSINHKVVETTGSWQRPTVDLSTVGFRKGAGSEKPLAQWEGDGWCPQPALGSRRLELGVAIGQAGFEPDADILFYLDRFQFGAGADIYDFENPAGEELPDPEPSPVVSAPVPLLPPLGLGILAILIGLSARRVS